MNFGLSMELRSADDTRCMRVLSNPAQVLCQLEAAPVYHNIDHGDLRPQTEL
jgi:hypothetical protein